jgi:RNA-directed DNA polymerase
MQLNQDKIKDEKISLDEVFEAYFHCRKNKRNTINALAFELDYENNLLKLYEEINSGSYTPNRSIAFIVNQPVKREIFAADFRDRIVHHLIINKLNPLFEKKFIHDSYACRVGKGTQYGIKRANKFIRKCSKNYTSDCYVLKLDIAGFFMHINQDLLFRRLKEFILENYHQQDQNLIITLCKKVIFNNPTKNCVIKSSQKEWQDLPNTKSLFYSPVGCGFPIGNLTSQIFANFYMDIFDHYIKNHLGIKYYGRYVDDFIIVHQEKRFLKSIIQSISNFLKHYLNLTLNPKKIYLQHYSKGVKFLGVFIKTNRIYVANRVKGNFYRTIKKHNKISINHELNHKEKIYFLSSTNSYLGIMKHYNTFRLRRKFLSKFDLCFWVCFKLDNDFLKISELKQNHYKN